jgi:gamma-glutamylcyclotransferase
MQKYFAYGSNLDFLHFKSRCSSAIFSEKAFLEGYKLTFPQYDIEWRGGVAGIIPSKNSMVEGVIYMISDIDLNKLDSYEDVAKGDYRRECMVVKNIDSDEVKAWTYIPKGIGNIFYKPTETYKSLILNGAMYNNFSEEYIEYLRSL